jgi:plasmid stabilization system protein ParE
MLGRTGRVTGSRELVISRTPYVAAYAVRGDAIIILHVFHGARLWPTEL